MTADRYLLDRARLASATELSLENHTNFQRLCKILLNGPAFQLLLVDCRDELLQKQLLGLLQSVLDVGQLPVARISLDDSISDVFALEARLQALAATNSVIHVLGAANWLNERHHPGRWAALNVLRERVAHKVGCKLLWWLDEETIAQMASLAPDWWAWRGGIYPFSSLPVILPKPEELQPRFAQIDSQSQEQAARRIAELKSWLTQEMDANLALPLHIELGDLLERQGQPEAALNCYRQYALPIARDLADDYSVATALGRIADILYARGQLDEALRIRQEEELPVYQRLGDIRNTAVTQGQIADILDARGQQDEALRIRQEEELPVYQRLGDVRSVAVTQGKIADLLFARGQQDEALRIRQEEQLPVLQRLGDIAAIVRCQVALGRMLWLRNQGDDRLLAQSYLQESLAHSERLQLAETARIKEIMQKMGIST